MTADLLSVVIPVHNVARYLDRTLQSIVTQTYPNLEIILVDDGSTDTTAAHIQAWQRQDARIKLVQLAQNRGISHARNAGLAQATGRFVTFVDGDDWCEPSLAAFYVQKMTQYHADLIICGYYIDPKGGLSDKRLVQDQTMKRRNLIHLVRKMQSPIRGYNWNKCYRLDVIRRYHLQFNETLSLMEDQVFNVAYILKTKNYLYNSRPLYHYCQRTDSSVHQPSVKKGWDVAAAIAIIQKGIWSQQAMEVATRWRTKKTGMTNKQTTLKRGR